MRTHIRQLAFPLFLIAAVPGFGQNSPTFTSIAFPSPFWAAPPAPQIVTAVFTDADGGYNIDVAAISINTNGTFPACVVYWQ